MRIVYLLEDTPLFGGVKVVLQHANLLHSRGHEVFVVGPGALPDWYPLEAGYVQTVGLGPHEIPRADVVVATYWTTIPYALEAGADAVVHFCQGYEGDHLHNRSDHVRIEEAYRHALPSLVVSPHLAELLERKFGTISRVVPPPLDPIFKPRARAWPSRSPRVLVTGPFEIYLKGVETALRAISLLRDRHDVHARLIRLSQWPLTEEERAVVPPDEFYHHLPPGEVPNLLRSTDLLLSASWALEGFGLPVLEAMATGVPVVASDIPSHRALAAGQVSLVPFDDPEAFASAASGILGSVSRWRRARANGLRRAEAFRAETIGDLLETALLELMG